MASNYRIERARGTKESSQQIALLRDKWPLAFPLEEEGVRPLTTGAPDEIAAVIAVHARGPQDLENGAGLLPGRPEL